ncbi:hypothetical protein [Adhaeribacter arboris]|uniref:hypothetical protein n=1 Tax=Adhaeribacter arboris TaxID=2072846 RepID=UPI0011B251B2|nr:hypothetical protein [Adhaeribacter arboris]
MSQSFQSTKKCKNCGNWSPWNQQINDTCHFCGHLLDEEAFLAQAKAEAEANEKKPYQINIDLIKIYPTDSFLVKIGKRMVQAVQISFVAILSFILWFLTMLAG